MRTIHDLEIKNMLRMANDAMARAYCPYSGYSVGACLKGSTGAYYLGCNIENAAYSPTICAERTALCKAVSEMERHFDALAIVSNGETCSPCGVCRQMLAEFCDAEMPIICANKTGKYKVFSLGELLPEAFTPKDLE
ncbi:MAG: cytidine deaminase [Eubacteriales bacterium]|nr:cytidine deaminase [Eubacteriales bacterium]